MPHIKLTSDTDKMWITDNIYKKKLLILTSIYLYGRIYFFDQKIDFCPYVRV